MNRFDPLLHELVSDQQHSFVPVRETAAHGSTAIAAFDVTGKAKEQIQMIMLDTEKAFDRVTWGSL